MPPQKPNPLNPFQRLLTTAGEHATDAGLFVLSMGAVAAIAGTGVLPEPLLALLGGAGWAAFDTLLGKATDNDLSNEDLLTAIREELAPLPASGEGPGVGFPASLEGQQTFLAEALAGVPQAVAAQLADALERQALLTTDGVKYLRREMVEVRRMVGDGQKELDQRVRDGVIYLRREIVDVKRMVGDLHQEVREGFARLAPQSGAAGRVSLPGRPTHFIGREDLLPQVQALQPEQVLTLWGAGGIGKTTLAAQALWDLHDAGDLLRRFPDGVLAYDFYGEPSPTGIYERIVYHFASGQGDKSEAAQIADRETARAALAGKRALLVLDGAENTPHLRDVLDVRGRCGVLITSRRSADVFETGLEVTALDEAKGVALLQTWGGPYAADTDACRGIYALVGELTLALELAGKYMQATQTPAADVQADLQTAPLDVLNLGGKRRDSVRVLLAKSVAALTEGARDALGVMGLLANRPFPFALLTAALGLDAAPTRKLLAELLNHGLATREGDAIRTRHALVHVYAREAVPAPKGGPARLADALNRAASSANNTGLPARYAPMRPHVAEAAVWAERLGLEDAGVLWNGHGYHLDMVGDYVGAQAAYERALAMDEATFGPAHHRVAIRVNNLAGVMQAQGDYVGARAAYARALAMDEATFGPAHPNVAIDVNNLAGVMRVQGDYAGARVGVERALAIWMQTLGEDHPDVAILHNNLGSVLQEQGDYVGARVAHARALAIFEQHLGENHPNVATLHNNLGGVMYAQGDYAGARAAYERSLAIWTQALGEEHPQVAIGHNNLGMVIQAQGDYAGARAAYVRALEIDEVAFGPDHPDVARDVSNLGGVMRSQGDYAGARTAFERSFRIRENAFGREHPDTAQSLWWLGVMEQEAGNLHEARKYLQEALRIYQKMPEGHPTIASVRGNLDALGSGD